MKRVVLTGCLLAGAACGARAQVRTPIDQPALNAPTPPARVIVPAPERPTLPPAEPVPADESPTPARGRETPTTRPTTASPPATPPAVEPPAPVVLSTSANTAEFERRIRAQIAKAETDLAAVNRQALGADARAQYDAARGFLRQCGEALKVRNLVFASQLADKAATLATMLRRL